MDGVKRAQESKQPHDGDLNVPCLKQRTCLRRSSAAAVRARGQAVHILEYILTRHFASSAATIAFVLLAGGGCRQNPPAAGLDSDEIIRLAKPTLELSEVALNQDTLVLVSGAKFFFHPFGDFTSVDAFERATKSLFTLRREIFKEPPGSDSPETILFRFSYSGSFVKCILPDDQESSRQLEIVSARILDSSVQFLNGVHTGISKAELLQHFFSSFPEDLGSQIKVVEVVTVLTGMWHYYDCSTGGLSCIVLDTDYQLPKD